MPNLAIPSTRQLIAFEMCAKTLSITASANALHLTQSAVSHQIKDLESLLNTPLFIRQKQRLFLTPEGEQYAKDIEHILTLLRQATLNLTSHQYNSELHFSLLPTLGSRWLIPRISEFSQQHPEVTLHFSTNIEPFDFSRSTIDAALHYGNTHWPDAHLVKLFDETLIPVCSKKFLAQNPIKHISDISALPRLALTTRPHDWEDCVRHYNIKANARHMFYFDHFTTLAEATYSHLGVALIPVFLFQKEIDAGDLIPLTDTPMISRGSYYFAYPKHRSDYYPVKALKQWLLDNIHDLKS